MRATSNLNHKRLLALGPTDRLKLWMGIAKYAEPSAGGGMVAWWLSMVRRYRKQTQSCQASVIASRLKEALPNRLIGPTSGRQLRRYHSLPLRRNRAETFCRALEGWDYHPAFGQLNLHPIEEARLLDLHTWKKWPIFYFQSVILHLPLLL